MRGTAGGVGSLGRHVQQARARAFVGRDDELAAVGAALRGDEASPSVFYVHGPGGIGKSSLLRRIADDARRAGRVVVEVDGRFVERSPAAFEAAAEPVWAVSRPALLVDSFEQCQRLEAWLRDRFLPRLGDDAVVVVAGRRPPELEWSVDPGWQRALRVLPLRPLDRVQAELLLHATDVDPGRHEALVRFAGGNPLALSLAAAVATAAPGQAAAWFPSAEVVGSLLVRLVGDVPSPAHRRALEAVAQAYSMTEDLLQAALPEEDAGTLFAWLRELPFIESGPCGLYPHDAARETLAADLGWRDPGTFHGIRARLGGHLLQRVRHAPERESLAAMDALLHLHRDDPSLPLPAAFERQGRVEDEPLDARALPVAVALTAVREGGESAALVRYWYDRQPEAFRLHRLLDTGEPVAFSARLRLDDPTDADDVAVDPVVAAAWRYCHDTAPLAPGEHIAITRFALYRELDQGVPPATTLVYRRALAGVCRSSGLAYGFVVHDDTAAWRQRHSGRLVDTGVGPVVGGRRYAVFAHDWRRVPFERWLTSGADDAPADLPDRVGPPLSRDDFDEAVREALLLFRHRRGLADSPLATAVLPPGAADADEALRAVLRDALASLRGTSRTLRGHDAVVATYLAGSATQQSAARRLQIPFSTYRRYLKQGVRDISDHLWEISIQRSG